MNERRTEGRIAESRHNPQALRTQSVTTRFGVNLSPRRSYAERRLLIFRGAALIFAAPVVNSRLLRGASRQKPKEVRPQVFFPRILQRRIPRAFPHRRENMKKPFCMLLAASAVFAGAPMLCAQEAAPMGPPKVLSITREYVKPGKEGSAHEKVEAGWPRAFARAKWSVHYVAMTSVTGKSEAWFLTPYDSFAALEKDSEAVEKNDVLRTEFDRLAQEDGELLTGAERLIGTLREDLSYGPPVNVAQMRYFDVAIVRVRPGHAKEYEELIKLIKAASDKSNTGDHWAAYEIVSGANDGTLIFFSPRKSMAIYDKFAEIYGKKFEDALGEGGMKKVREIESNGVMGEEDRLFAFSPKMSYVSEDWVKADPDFWKPKAAPAKAGAGTKKKAETKPAASQ
jgi:hypothetical protein